VWGVTKDIHWNQKKDNSQNWWCSLHIFQETQHWTLCELWSLGEEAIKDKPLNISQSCFKASKGRAIRFMLWVGVALWHRMMVCQKKCYISNTLDGSEDVIVWEDDVEGNDDSEWVKSTDNNQLLVMTVNLRNDKL
jgi:hypothetical protein